MLGSSTVSYQSPLTRLPWPDGRYLAATSSPAASTGSCDGARRDRLLQPQGQPVLLLGPFLGVGELLAGGGERELGVVVGGDVLIGAADGDHGRRPGR